MIIWLQNMGNAGGDGIAGEAPRNQGSMLAAKHVRKTIHRNYRFSGWLFPVWG